MTGLLCGLFLALWDRVGRWVPFLKEKTNKTAVPVLSTPLAFQKRTNNGSAKRRGGPSGKPVLLFTNPWSRAGLEGRGGASSLSPHSLPFPFPRLKRYPRTSRLTWWPGDSALPHVPQRMMAQKFLTVRFWQVLYPRSSMHPPHTLNSSYTTSSLFAASQPTLSPIDMYITRARGGTRIGRSTSLSIQSFGFIHWLRYLRCLIPNFSTS